MRSNRWESFLGITTFGESHGKAIGVVLEDIKPGIPFPLEQIQQELNKRKPGDGKFASARKETDKIQVISGVLDGVTTGLPICLLIYNRDHISSDYEELKKVFRPGHADFGYYKKFKIYDYRGGGRASGRETISRVAASGMVTGLLGAINIVSYPVQIGTYTVSNIDLSFKNEINWPDRSNYEDVIHLLECVKEEGNSIGGIVECSISNIPAGLGDPVFEKLDANLSKAVISIGSVKGIEFGDGFKFASYKGNEANDQMSSKGFLTNRSGGIIGGISTGENIRFRFVVKPTPSIKILQSTVNNENKDVQIKLKGRFDICIIPRIIPVVNAMVKLVLADALSYQKLVENTDLELSDYREAIDKIDEDILISVKRRLKIAELIGKFKHRNKIQTEDRQRELDLKENLKIKADDLGLNSQLVTKIWELLIQEAKELQ